MSVVLSQPHRNGETSHLAGFVLGRLLLTKQINSDQFHAGERYGQLAARHMRDVLGDLSGAEFYARITSQTQNRLDRKLLEARFGADAVAECCKAVVVAKVVLVEREPDEAAA